MAIDSRYKLKTGEEVNTQNIDE